MFPEENLRAAFWNFVFGRALDARTLYEVRPRSIVLDTIDEQYDFGRFVESDEALGEEPGFDAPDEGSPRVYPTLQEALVAFLIDGMAKNEFPYSYEVWVRTVVLVMADIHKRPDWWLQLKVRRYGERRHARPDDSTPWEVAEYDRRMTVSDDWSCLYREVFDLVRQAHGGTEPPPEEDSPEMPA